MDRTNLTSQLTQFVFLLTAVAFLSAVGCSSSGGDSSDGSSVDSGATDTSDTTDTPVTGSHGRVVANHNATGAFDSIPASTFDTIRSSFNIFYGHTSHGSQILTGLNMLERADGNYSLSSAAGALTFTEEETDLGHEGDLSWVDVTRDVLDQPGNTFNMVVWAWCAGVSDNTPAGINAYLSAMNQLEAEYPHVIFVYMTGHLDGSGPSGTLYQGNNQIRSYCGSNNKVLFDFADIESYDPNGQYYPNDTEECEWCDNWCSANPCPTCDDCQHSNCFNCYQKGKAFWYMLARLAGWNG